MPLNRKANYIDVFQDSSLVRYGEKTKDKRCFNPSTNNGSC
jgi:hypothetical protein